MNPASSSLTSSASSPFDATLPTAVNSSATTSPLPTYGTSERTRKCIIYGSIIASFGAFGWYLNKGITAVLSYQEVSEELETWESAWAVVTGRNQTYPSVDKVGPFLPYFVEKVKYCALMTYDTVEGESVTATNLGYCADSSKDVVIGEEMEILYNPENVGEILEKAMIDDSLGALIGATAVVMAFSLGFLACAILLWRKRDMPLGLEREAHRRRRVVHNRGADGDLELAPEQKLEREEQIVKYFHFESVANDVERVDTKTSEEFSEEIDVSTTTEDSVSVAHHCGDQCCICMEKYYKGDHTCTPKTSECNHIFHKACLLEWLQKHDHCPLCRTDLLQE